MEEKGRGEERREKREREREREREGGGRIFKLNFKITSYHAKRKLKIGSPETLIMRLLRK